MSAGEVVVAVVGIICGTILIGISILAAAMVKAAQKEE